MSFKAIMLPGYPYRVLVLDLGLIAPVKIVNRASRGAKLIAELSKHRSVDRTWLIEGYTVTERKERRVVLPPMTSLQVWYEKETEITYTWFAIDVGFKPKRVTARQARRLILEHCANYMPSSGRQTYIDYFVRSLQWIREFFYVSAHEIEKLDVNKIRSSSDIVDGRCAKYVLLNKYRAVLVT